MLLTSAERLTPAICLKDIERSVLWESLCLFISTPCSSISRRITPWSQQCGQWQCRVSMVRDGSLWAVGHYHLHFTIQMFNRERDWNEHGGCVCAWLWDAPGIFVLFFFCFFVWFMCLFFACMIVCICLPLTLCVEGSVQHQLHRWH